MEIKNSHILSEFERIKKELKQRGYIVREIPLSEDEQMLAHFIALYDSTKNLID